MANWHPVDTTIGYQPIETTETTQKHPEGSLTKARHETYGVGEFIYLKGVASTAIGSLVIFDQYLHTTTLAPATGGIGPVAVSMAANIALQWGWYCISGAVPVLAPNAMTAGADVFMLAATPGSVDDAVVASEQVVGAVVSTSTGTPYAVLTVCPSATGCVLSMTCASAPPGMALANTVSR